MPPRKRAFFWLTVINFAAFVIGTFVIGGDALNGEIREGHYFVGSHNDLKEVSRTAYWYSFVHALSAFTSMPVALAIAALARSRLRRQWMSDRNN